MVHVHAPLRASWLRASFGAAALLVMLPGCPTDPVPIDDTGTSTSAGSSSTDTPPPNPDSTTGEPPCGTGGCPPEDSGSSSSGSSGGDSGSTGSATGTDSGSTSDGSSSGGGSSSGEPGSSGTTDGLSAGTGSSTDGGFETGIFFIIEPDVPLAFECDPFAQDCPVGEKCGAWASSGGTWDATACFPIDPAAVGVGETCVVQGAAVSGVDNCELGAMCWDVDEVTNEGTCVALCTGSAVNPICAAGTSCAISNDGSLNLCLPDCDPLLQDCIAGQACYPIGAGFTCAPDASGAQGLDGDPCEFINVCDPGLMCINGDAVEGCFPAAGCCTPFCVVGGPVDTCPSALEECLPYFDVGMAPPGFEDVGVCAVP